MCSRTTCRSCGLASWSGCGAHVEQVMRGIPKDQRCTCGGASSSRDLRERRSLSGRLARMLGR
jgi:Na+-translocating ferredoxin:NAD+ oxidoreductase RNF subunit RnfB